MKVDLFLALVRSGLYERPLAAEELASARTATDADWAAILEVARQQTVLGQLYQALFQLPTDVRPPEAVVTTLMSDALRAVRHAYTAATASQDLVERLRAAGLAPVVMKGVSVAAFYRHPEFRTAGDIDIHLPSSEIKQAAALLDESAVSPDGSRTGRFEGVAVDLHDRYFDLHCATRKLPAVGTPEATLLMLSAHILKHAIGPGVGLRQLCDMAMACRGLAGSFDPARLREIFRQTGTLRWNRLLFSFLVEQLGLDEQIFAQIFGTARVASAPLLDIVLEGGNFGHYAAARRDRIAAGTSHRKRDTLRRFLHRLPFSLRFAPCETLATIWTLIQGNLRRSR